MTRGDLIHIVDNEIVGEYIPDETEVEFQVMQLPRGLKNGGGVDEQINMIIHLPERLTVFVLQTKKMKEA